MTGPKPDLPVFNKVPFSDLKVMSEALHLSVSGVTLDGRAHLVQHEPCLFLVKKDDTTVETVTAQQLAWFLENGSWEPEVVCEFGIANSISFLVLPGVGPLGDNGTSKDEQDLALVQKQAVTLADLYRKGKKRGLITARTGY